MSVVKDPSIDAKLEVLSQIKNLAEEAMGMSLSKRKPKPEPTQVADGTDGEGLPDPSSIGAEEDPSVEDNPDDGGEDLDEDAKKLLRLAKGR